jgi:hypothetical protein
MRGFHGVPFRRSSIAKKYNTDKDAEKLVKLLKDPKEKDIYLPTIVAVLGIIGRQRDIETLTDFVKDSHREDPSNDVFMAQLAALRAIGELTNKSRNEVAVPFLREVMSRGVNSDLLPGRGCHAGPGTRRNAAGRGRPQRIYPAAFSLVSRSPAGGQECAEGLRASPNAARAREVAPGEVTEPSEGTSSSVARIAITND